jgi:hypothetical protein
MAKLREGGSTVCLDNLVFDSVVVQKTIAEWVPLYPADEIREQLFLSIATENSHSEVFPKRILMAVTSWKYETGSN